MENDTLTIALILVSVVSTIALFANWAGNRHIPGLLIISLGFAFTSVGILLLTTQGTASPVISILLANALILGGRIPVVLGLAQFWNQEQSKIPIVATAGYFLTMTGFYYFTLVDDDMLWRIRIYTLMMVSYALCNIYLIANGLRIEKKLRPVMAVSSNFGAFLALMLFSFNAVTEFILMMVRSGAPLTNADEGTSFLLLGSIFTMAVFAFAIIIMTMEELCTATRTLARATNLPLIVDGDTGYGEALNVMRLVRELEDAGAAAVQIEDQVLPKKCGHLNDKQLATAEDAARKIAAAVAARRHLLVVARTDAAAESLDEAIRRANLYVAAGADIIFPDALISDDDFHRFAAAVKAPVLANMT